MRKLLFAIVTSALLTIGAGGVASADGGHHAHRFSHQNQVAAQSQAARSDVDKDGVVSVLDLALIVQHMGDRGDSARSYDQNGDGRVTSEDVQIAAGSFRQSAN